MDALQARLMCSVVLLSVEHGGFLLLANVPEGHCICQDLCETPLQTALCLHVVDQSHLCDCSAETSKTLILSASRACWVSKCVSGYQMSNIGDEQRIVKRERAEGREERNGQLQRAKEHSTKRGSDTIVKGLREGGMQELAGCAPVS